MKQTSPASCISCKMLKFIRDRKPTETEFISWLGSEAEAGRYHVLRKAGLLAIDAGNVILAPDHLSSDSRSFAYGNQIYLIDEDIVMILRSDSQ